MREKNPHVATFVFRVREKLGCKGNFPEVYDKVNKKARAGAP